MCNDNNESNINMCVCVLIISNVMCNNNINVILMKY